MMTDEFESELREALTRCAEEVPPDVGERLRQHNYRPSGRRYVAASVAVVVVSMGVGAAALSSGTNVPGVRRLSGDASSPSTSAVPLTGSIIRLAGITIRLPAGFKPTYRPCAPRPSGLVAPITGFNLFASAASNTGGCIDVLLASSSSQAPAGSQSVTVGGYRGALFADQSRDISTLYVTIPAADLDVVFTAEGLSASGLESTAAAPMPNLARQLVALAAGTTG